MTWTCTKCQNVNPTSECKCLRDGCDGTPWKEAGLSEEERAAWEAVEAALRDAGCVSSVPIAEWGNVDRAFAVAFLKAARAPLEDEVKTLRGALDRWDSVTVQLGRLGLMGDGNREPSGVAVAALERQAKRVQQVEGIMREMEAERDRLEAQLAQAQNLQSNEHVRVHGMGQESTRELFVAWLIAEGADDLVSKIEANGGWPPEVTRKAQKPAAPAGLPEVGSTIRRTSFQPKLMKVSEHMSDDHCRPKFRTEGGAEFWLEDEGKNWERIPPAQTSQERGTTPKGVRAAIDEAIRRFGGQSDGMFNLANFSAALKMQTGARDAYDGNLCRVILADRDDVEMCSPGDAHYRLKRPAASPPGEVSTEYIDKWCNFPPHSTSRICIVSDIRANVEREIERHQIEIARMEGRIDAQRKVNEALEMAARLLTGERDAALAEVKRLKGELAKANEGKANP